MKIVVCSDLHGQELYLDLLRSQYASADGFVFLGDGLEDFISAPQRPAQFHLAVAGNCDWSPSAERLILQSFDGVRTLMTHGHLQGAKGGTDGLWALAKQNQCRLVLYGHTHRQIAEEREGVILLCPGALKNGDYALLQIENGNVEIQLKSI